MQKIDPIEIKTYDPNWPHIYEKEATLIGQALSGNCLAIHHIGSTAVPGLAAKPKIDMIAVVKDGDLSITQLEDADYAYRGEWNIPFKFGFTKRGQNDFNLHIFEESNPEIELNILFRDYLRAHPDRCKEYRQLKANLLADQSNHQKNGAMFVGYTLGKDIFIRQILRDARYTGHRFLRPTHHQEWEDYHRIRKTEILDPLGVMYDANHPSMTSSTAQHFILCCGVDVRTVAHIDILNQSQAALRALATDKRFQSQGYASALLVLIEKWLKKQGIHTLHTHSHIHAKTFYEKQGFTEMPGVYPSSFQAPYIDLGKVL